MGFDQLQPPPAALALADAWSNARETTLVQTLVDSHCGQLRAEDAAPLTRAQRARDAVIADSLLRYRANGAVLIAGAGHARRDLAVPLYLRARAPDASIASVALTEVEPGVDDVAAYRTTAVVGSIDPPFDYLWFSARAEREDPCAGFSLPKRSGDKATPGKTERRHHRRIKPSRPRRAPSAAGSSARASYVVAISPALDRRLSELSRAALGPRDRRRALD